MANPKQLAGRAFGDLDPALPGNALIHDVGLAKDPDSKVRYAATFILFKPVDMKRCSGLLWRDAPLGTYLGWNITAAGFHKDQICNYVGGMIPFARTAQERVASGDPRLSLQERYGSHDGYVDAVRRASERALREGFLLQPDAAALVRAAQDSAVLNEARGR